jgi:tripartite-type tricarboxylate transporter receptor subunit TctC
MLTMSMSMTMNRAAGAMPARPQPDSRSHHRRGRFAATVLAGLLGTATLLTAAAAHAADAPGSWPNRPVRIVVNFPAGGPADIIGRSLGTKLATVINQPVVVENRAGAGGVIGTDSVAKAAPDGYTLLVCSAGSLAIAPGLTTLPYDPDRDLAPITQIVDAPEVLVAIPKLGVKTLPELLTYARTHPGRISFASSGPASMPHLGGELLKREASLDIVHVPYKGAAPAVNDLLGGQVDIMFADIPVVLQHIQSGRLLALAMGNVRRAPTLPAVPTTAESGLPGVLANNWYGLLAPGGTPREIIGQIHQAAAAALRMPELIDTLTRLGALPVASSPEAFTAFIRAERARWVPVARAAGAKWE